MPKTQTSDQPVDAVRPPAPEVLEAQANAKVAEEDRSDEVKCDNHPHRKARTFTGGGSYSLNLCDECTPTWFKQD